jgi:hypothetical protein
MEGHERRAVKKHRVTACGDERGHYGLHILLVELTRATAQIPVAFLVRPEAEEGLVRGELELELGFERGAIKDGLVLRGPGASTVDAVGIIDHGILAEDDAKDFLRSEPMPTSGGFAYKLTAVGMQVGERSCAAIDAHSDCGCPQCKLSGVFMQLEGCPSAVCGNDAAGSI